MCPVVDNPATCVIHTVICILHARNMSAMAIHHELCMVYGQNVMNEGTVRHWRRMFRDGRTNVHYEEWRGLPSVVNDDLVKVLTKIFVKDGASQFQNFHVNFHKYHALFSMRLLQLDWTITSFVQDGF
jgi:hypothetical protein